MQPSARKGIQIIAAAVLTLGVVGGLGVVSLSGLAALLATTFWPAPQRVSREAERKALAGAPQLASAAVLLDAISVPLIVLDQRGNVTRANMAARTAFPGCRTGVPISAALRAPEVLAAIDEVLQGRENRLVEWAERVPLERSFSLAIQRLPVEAVSATEHVILQASETTESRRIEAMRVDFVANASHELRTPLASILGFIETLEGPAREDEKARSRFLTIMRQQGERMARLVEDLLSLSRIEMKAHIAPSERVDLALLLPQLFDSLSGIARERAVQLRLDTSHPEARNPLPITVIGDRDELLRLFENLIENAIKYGGSGGKVDVLVRPDEDKREWRISVRDYGPGIAARHLPRLTERFYRADVQESRIQGGTGLGLALVKHIVTRHRGRLAVESIEGQGATFTVFLPMAVQTMAFEPSALRALEK